MPAIRRFENGRGAFHRRAEQLKLADTGGKQKTKNVLPTDAQPKSDRQRSTKHLRVARGRPRLLLPAGCRLSHQLVCEAG